jgi:hypothetical protein
MHARSAPAQGVRDFALPNRYLIGARRASSRVPMRENHGVGERAHVSWLTASSTACLDAPVRSSRDVALVIADPPLAAVIAELYRAYGYEVYVLETPLDVIQMLIGVGERTGVAVLSPDARWADGMRDFLADEYPAIDRILLAA